MSIHHPAQNHLLAALPADELERLRPDLELVAMPSGRVVHEDGIPQHAVYFPTDCIVALLYTMANGASAKAALVGNEGLVGMASFMGGETATGQAVVQMSGYAYSLPATVLNHEFRRGGRLRDVVLGFTQALIAQMIHTAVCHRHHSSEQQLCRWLLLCAERQKQPVLNVTLATMSQVLGVPSESIARSLASLQASEVLRFRQGAIEILDFGYLDDLACECHGAIAREYDRLLGTDFSARVRNRDRERASVGRRFRVAS